ncbi:hypothetical protein BJY01DRAFT_201330 [Aspergillus pseudoustus]|uniref:NADH:flavin oxidoreductase/NADH oxidase N-terminal domain-containing protein n=1 Tax=Aspergillus pseudoustus TaxID=1810923 RepID=A0ABR4L2G6_9EURO
MASPNVLSLAQAISFPLSGKTVRNRVYRTALSEYSGSYDENNIENCGKPLPRYIELHKEMAAGGAGLICFGNIPVHRDHMENINNAILDPNNAWNAVDAFRPAIAAAMSQGAICLPQLTFPGRQVPDYVNKHPKSASDVQLGPSMDKTYGQPTPLSRDEIKDLVNRFAWAAHTVVKAGADGIVLHAAHGYGFNQFLSPETNKRTDEYGGSLENRARFLLEVVAAIKANLPVAKYVIGVKLNCHDFSEGGTSFAEQCVVLKWLEDAGVDFFDVSGGTYATPAWRGNIQKELTDRPIQRYYGSYFIEWAQEMKKVLSRAVIGTTGGWRDAHRMAEAVREGKIDMCGLGRPLRENPFFVSEILEGKVRTSNL